LTPRAGAGADNAGHEEERRRMSQKWKCFRVESAEPYGWVVYQEGSTRAHFFVGRSLALALAKLFAQALAPSRVRLVDLSGRVTDEWAYAPRMMRS
jgi:hypothetical protein